MSVLLLRLAGPMQSWGTRSRFSNRDTGLEPSRSGVVGLLCAALGRPRDASLDDFVPLQMAVRVDREGQLMRDYHTAQIVKKYDEAAPTSDTVPTDRFYLADADFLVALGGDAAFLGDLAAALASPVWQLCLGRKAFVPGLPVCEGVVAGDLYGAEDAAGNRELLPAFVEHPWWKRTRDDFPPNEGSHDLPRDRRLIKKLRFVVEKKYGTGEPRQDVPLSFVSRERKFAVRHVGTEFHSLVPAQVRDRPEKEPPCS